MIQNGLLGADLRIGANMLETAERGCLSYSTFDNTKKTWNFVRSFGNPGCCGWDTRAPF